MAIKLEDKKAIVAEVNEAAKAALSAVVADARGVTVGAMTGLRKAVSYTHLRAHETGRNLVCRLLLEKKKKKIQTKGHQSESGKRERSKGQGATITM